MRIEKQRVIDASREEVWEKVSDPSKYQGFMHNYTMSEQEGDLEKGKGARYSIRMRVGSADVGGLVEVVEFDEPGDLAWTSVTGIDQRVPLAPARAARRPDQGHVAAQLRRARRDPRHDRGPAGEVDGGGHPREEPRRPQT